MYLAPSPIERVLAQLTQPGDDAVSDLLAGYYAPNYRFSGSAFDQLVQMSAPGSFTPADVVAVSSLSVSVPTTAAMWLLDDSECRDLLRLIPTDATLWGRPDLLDEGGAAWALWERVRTRPGVGRVITSKLLAAKRPISCQSSTNVSTRP